MTSTVPEVLHVIPTMDPIAGGPPVVADRLAALASGNGFSARVLTAVGAGECGAYETVTLNGQIEALTPRGRSKLAAEIERADVVHLHTLWSPLVGAAARVARAVGKPYVLAPHGMLDPWSMKQKALKKRLYWAAVEGSTARGAAALLFTTEDERALALSTVTVSTPAEVIPLGADAPPASREELAAEFAAAHPGYAGRPIMVFLGRLHAKKRPEALVEAMPEILQTCPDALALFVGGGAADFERQLGQRAADLDITGSVAFLGHLNGREKWQALAAGTVFVLASQQENFAIAAVEALGIGLPVLLTRTVNIWEAVDTAGAGVVLQDGDLPGGIARAAIRLLADDAVRSAMSRNAARLAREKFDWAQCAERTCALYRRLL